MTSGPPNASELEISVFGPGFGESICVHLGDGEWMVVDSCLEPTTGEPASLKYLDDLGVNPAHAVRLIVITHWDDDHIRGIARVVEACPDATVVCSAALNRREVVQFVMEQEGVGGALGSGLDELRSVLRLCAARQRQIIWAKANLPLHPQPPGRDPVVIALSPSDNAFERGLIEVIEQATGRTRAIRRRFQAPEGPNGTSVVTSVSLPECDEVVLLGADLERSNNPDAGWEAVVRDAAPADPATLVKVPHHGSEDAYYKPMWTDLCTEEPVAIITPMVFGGNDLPLANDVERTRKHASPIYLTAEPRLIRASQDPAVERLLRRLHGERLRRLVGWGQVRARRIPGESWHEWQVELGGDAVVV